MGDTVWFDRSPGEYERPISVVHLPDDLGGGEGCSLLMGDFRVPDRCRAPEELGGMELRVLGSEIRECPACEPSHDVRHFDLEGAYHVAECPRRGFLWYTLTAPKEAG